jgi:hypothetical protein
MELIAEYLGRDLVPFINLEDRVHDLTPAQRLQGLDDAAQRLQGLDAAQRLQGLSLEDIRDSLSDEERQALRQLLDDQESDT